MNRDESEAAANVMLAYASGKPIQIRRRRCPPQRALEKWRDAYTSPSWNWDLYDYRIKPPPARLWASLTSGGKPAYVHAEKPQQAADPRNRPYRRFVEDLEGDSYD